MQTTTNSLLRSVSVIRAYLFESVADSFPKIEFVDNHLSQSYSEFTGSRPGSPQAPARPEFLSSTMAQEKVTTTQPGTVVPRDGGPPIRVLLAEDDRALRRFLQVVLERAGYEVIPAADGLEAMKLALASPVDIVVTDAMMPNLSGHEFCRFLRNSQTLADVPVILLSALERKEDNADQVNAFLAKPVSAESLVECVETVLGNRKT